MKISSQKVGSSLKGIGTKDSAKTLLWLIAIGFILFFSKKVFSWINGLLNFGKTETAENLAIVAAGKTEFSDYSRTFKWSATGVSTALIDTEVAQAVQYMSGWKTDWTSLNAMIVKMTPVHFIGFFIKFGVRINDEFSNQAGDFVDWLNMEKGSSILAYTGVDPTSPIKNYLNKMVIPYSNNAFPSITTRLKKINNK